MLINAILLNDTAFSARSGGPQAMEETPVQMLSADIRIKVPQSTVTVTYRFRNTSDKPATALMGFPEEGYDATLEDRKTWFTSFRSWIDGQETNPLATKITDPEAAEWGYKVWWTKQVPFRPNQTRTVRNVYTSQPGGDTSPRSFFTYITRTARTWKGPIGSLRIEIDATGLPKGTPFAFWAKPHKFQNEKALYYWENVEPDETTDAVTYWIPSEFDIPPQTNLADILPGQIYTAR